MTAIWVDVETASGARLGDGPITTATGALKGWLKIYVQDDQATNPIVDGVFFVPFYAAPTA